MKVYLKISDNIRKIAFLRILTYKAAAIKFIRNDFSIKKKCIVNVCTIKMYSKWFYDKRHWKMTFSHKNALEMIFQ